MDEPTDPVEWTVFSARCPSRESLARIANKWTAMIVILLHEEPRRFGELHAEVEGITKKVLTDTLRALQRDGMVTHPGPGDSPPRYHLTPLGRTLHEPLLALQRWAEAHVDEVLVARSDFDTQAADAVLDGVEGLDGIDGIDRVVGAPSP